MRASTLVSLVAALAVPAHAAAQGTNPVADAFRANASRAGTNLMAAAADMPAEKYDYKPTAPQMTYAAIVEHLAEGNDLLCGAIAGTKAPERAKVGVADGKAKLVARLQETFAFCDQALAKLDDTKLAEPLEVFGQKMSRAAVMTLTTADWADHYSQVANYLRLNGMVPPTAKR